MIHPSEARDGGRLHVLRRLGREDAAEQFGIAGLVGGVALAEQPGGSDAKLGRR